jgi:hypothetical protein
VLHVLDERDAVHDGHVDIADDEVDLLPGELVDGVLAVFGLNHRITCAPQGDTDHSAYGCRVVHDHDGFAHGISRFSAGGLLFVEEGGYLGIFFRECGAAPSRVREFCSD